MDAPLSGAMDSAFNTMDALLPGAMDAPFSQPRNIIGGHFLSALVGVRYISSGFLILLNPVEKI